MYRQIKVFIDILISLVLLPFVILIIIPVSIAIKLDDGGDIFYISKRYGLHMKKFNMFKFRTMKMNCPDIRNSDGSTYNSETDTRLTRVGKFLRKTSIDELPQLFNVLCGDMSLIGPRPSPMGNEYQYSDTVRRKFDVRPGITGYTQVLYRNTVTQEQRYSCDIYYVENLSFLLDIKVFLMTLLIVFQRKNIYRY